MRKKPIATMSLVLGLAVASVAFSTAPAAASVSPGACNMLHVSPQGMAGMLKASGQGLDNMMALVVASEESGCVPR